MAQDLSNLRKSTIYTYTDSIRYDTMATVAGSALLTDTNYRTIPDTAYKILPWKSTIILSPGIRQTHRVFILKYRVMPESLTRSFYHKNNSEIRLVPDKVFTYKKFAGRSGSEANVFHSGNIIQSGSISRGLTIGNNQDAVVNSGMDLQLSGKLSNDMQIMGAISDKNIPIQADGTTQEIRDLDRVYLKVYNDQTTIRGGDFSISEQEGYFMNLHRKVQGAGVTHQYKMGRENQAVSSVNGAISRGRFCVKSFQGEEGNQGPYRLNGCNNETHIIILSGSERVYVDGEQLKRGKNNDYIINYNTSELTFTSNRPITKDKRIQVEFEYSLNEYARFTAFTHHYVKTDQGKFWMNLYSEHDSKNQTLAQELTDNQRSLLYSIGDDLEKAIVPYVDTGNYKDDRVLYIQKDTLVNGQRHGIYQYSNNPAEARYKVGFSHVGKNKGNYVPIKSRANGRVYEWVAPNQGVPQGSYSPLRTLITPKKQQMLTFGSSGNISSSTSSYFEMALSNNDLNTFSPKDQGNNKGYALKFSLDRSFLLADTARTQLNSSIAYRGVQKNFQALERFKAVEFQRNWNLTAQKISGSEHLLEGTIDFYNHKLGESEYRFEYLTYGKEYSGYRNHLNADLSHSQFQLAFSGSYLQTAGRGINTDFIRYRSDLGRQFHTIRLGVKKSGEYNLWQSDSLMGNSFSYNQWEFYITNADTATNHYFVNYRIREDQSPLNRKLKPTTLGKDLNLGLEINSMENNRLKARITYRQLEREDSTLPTNKPEENLLGRIEHSGRVLNNFLTTSTNFEVGSGLEPRREFTYIEVPAGQGAYTWADYNKNGVKELDEFEKAKFSDQADYLRIFRPSGEYYKTYTNELNQMINLKPAQIIKDTSLFHTLIAKLSDQFAFSIRRKNQQKNFWKNINPFAFNIGNPLVLSQNSNLRNTFSFNRNSPLYTINYVFLKSTTKLLLMNGTDLKKQKKQAIHTTWSITPDITMGSKTGLERSSFESSYFQNKNYRIESLNESFSLQYRPSPSLRTDLDYAFSRMNNRAGVQKGTKHQVSTKLNYSRNTKFRIWGEISYIHYKYDFPNDTPVAYQMLEGLNPGENGTWSLILQKEIYKNLQLNFNYSGRVSEKQKAIHTGQVELRASF